MMRASDSFDEDDYDSMSGDFVAKDRTGVTQTFMTNWSYHEEEDEFQENEVNLD